MEVFVSVGTNSLKYFTRMSWKQCKFITPRWNSVNHNLINYYWMCASSHSNCEFSNIVSSFPRVCSGRDDIFKRVHIRKWIPTVPPGIVISTYVMVRSPDEKHWSVCLNIVHPCSWLWTFHPIVLLRFPVLFFVVSFQRLLSWWTSGPFSSHDPTQVTDIRKQVDCSACA